MDTKQVTQESKGLKGGPCGGMQLRWGNVERPKNTYREIVEGKGDIKI